jgi:hypothetical protein
MAEDNLGRNGWVFKECHGVNGCSLKYADDLPKRINVEFSVLFADRAQRRLLGLPSPKKEVQPDIPLRTVPFVSPCTKMLSKLSVSGIPSDPLSVSSHEVASRRGIGGGGGDGDGGMSVSGWKKISFDPLSVSYHVGSEASSTNR